MKIISSNKYKLHNPPFEIYDGVKEAYAEKPERIDAIVNELKKNKSIKFIFPKHFPKEYLYAIHQKEYVNFLQNKSKALSKKDILYPSYFITDTYAPIVNGTFEAAISSVNIALTGAKNLLNGEKIIYSLCRPPGHHAEYNSMGGYCYFNNAAIATNYLSKKGKVAILDIDFHHGNGTQNSFYERSDVFYVSIHADPKVKYPYISGFTKETGKDEGLGFNKNYPLPLGTVDGQYLKTLNKAIKNIQEFKPKYLVVSAGFDTYEKDPIGGFKLTVPFYKTIGFKIKSLNLPTLVIQEGGYCAEDLGKIASSLVSGLI
jgi:acetoin utilization deacetylase AcuC-like enzyme